MNKKKLLRLIAPAVVSILGLISKAASAEDLPVNLATYVTDCQRELEFQNVAIPALDCNDGFLFDHNVQDPSKVNDYVGYKRLTKDVDMTFACRWLSDASNNPTGNGPFTNAQSVELIIHNRQKGSTCFFAGRHQKPNTFDNSVPAVMVSLTTPAADAYWMSPTELNNSALKCVGCHIAGPYIASPKIAPFLGRLGLLNDGHDTHVMSNDASGNRVRRYHAVNGQIASGRTFSGWDTIVDNSYSPGCSYGCHVLGDKSTTPHIAQGTFTVIPSISEDIGDVRAALVMPDASVKRNLHDDYRWMNIDIPDDANTTGDVETFYPVKNNAVGFSQQLNRMLTCETEPAYMEAQLIGSKGDPIRTNEVGIDNLALPDKLERFDQTGLICRNAAQTDGTCSNYSVRFVCFKDQLSVYSHWTGQVVTIAYPDANQIRWAKGQPLTSAWYGSQTWHLEAVNNGTSNNYVRFRNDWSGNYLNADISGYVSNAGFRSDWLSEQWVMEYVAGTHFVRFRNLWQPDPSKPPGYLTMYEDSTYSPVNLQPLHTDSAGKPNWTSQEWELK